MEQMDSTVIATSLPAIAADLGTSPVALKLAVTSYLVALAIFIPISGWMSDRFGAKNVFRARHRRLRPRLGRLRLLELDPRLRPGALPPGHRRLDDDAGRAPRARARHAAQPARLGDGVADDPRPRRPDHRAAARGVPHHLSLLALGLLDQRADRPPRPRPGHALPARPASARTPRPIDCPGFFLTAHRFRRLRLRHVGHQPPGPAGHPVTPRSPSASSPASLYLAPRPARAASRCSTRRCSATRSSAPPSSAARCSASASAPFRSCCR